MVSVVQYYRKKQLFYQELVVTSYAIHILSAVREWSTLRSVHGSVMKFLKVFSLLPVEISVVF